MALGPVEDLPSPDPPLQLQTEQLLLDLQLGQHPLVLLGAAEGEKRRVRAGKLADTPVIFRETLAWSTKDNCLVQTQSISQ